MAVDPYVYECRVFGDFHDPLAVRRKLMLLSNGELNNWIEDSRSEDDLTSARGYERLLPVVREAFRLPTVDPVTGFGVSDHRAVEVLNGFLEWLEGKG